jgi:hydrogenase maturation protease
VLVGTNETTLVLGLGNVLMGDEGIGVYVVRELEKHALPAGVECLDGGTGGFTLLEPLENADRIILIDAASDGNPIGTITRTTPRFSRDYPPTLTAHDVGMKDLLDMFYIQGGTHEIVLYRSSAANPDESFARRGDCGCRRRGAHFGGVTGRRRRGSVASGSKFPFAFTRSSGYHNCYGR